MTEVGLREILREIQHHHQVAQHLNHRQDHLLLDQTKGAYVVIHPQAECHQENRRPHPTHHLGRPQGDHLLLDHQIHLHGAGKKYMHPHHTPTDSHNFTDLHQVHIPRLSHRLPCHYNNLVLFFDKFCFLQLHGRTLDQLLYTLANGKNHKWNHAP